MNLLFLDIQSRLRRNWKLLPVTADELQQVLLLGLVFRQCCVVGLDKSDSSLGTVIDNLEEIDLGFHRLEDGVHRPESGRLRQE